ncbi:MAG: peptidyl-prolyl cis-trans isomerase [Kofleriaceae bacterium]|nr:peptidyl-prolyl cis-trans isomerase [Myxococcales bacterium]MCB9563770.1 peptidyl-prolyl cis-trans isomerase [Kofleriaceae bacterium]
MSRTSPHTLLVAAVALVASVAATGCDRRADSAAPPPAPRNLPAAWSPDTVASVNGHAITRADLTGAPRGHGDDAAPATEELDDVIGLELAAQQAEALGLDRDPAYQQELHALQAPAQAFRRHRLAELYFDDQVTKQIQISDADARAYFDANAARIRSQVHVWQILARDRTEIEQVQADLAAGQAFEDVARARLPDLPAGVRPPWDVAPMHWNQVPEAWRAVLDTLQPGQVSDVIAGPRGRYWVIKLLERTDDPSITFDTVEDTIVALLRDERATARRAELAHQLRADATIVKGKTGDATVATPAPGAQPAVEP